MLRGVLVRPPTRVTGRGDRGAGVAVIRAVCRENLVLVGVDACHPDRILDRIGATVGEEDLRHVRTCYVDDPLRSFAALVVGVLWRDGRELGCLLLDGRDHLRVLMADVHVDQLRGEVQELVAVVVPDVRAFRCGDAHGIQRCLRAPRVEHVLTVEVVDALAFGRIRGKRHGVSSMNQSVPEA